MVDNYGLTNVNLKRTGYKDEAEAQSAKFSALAKQNKHPQHLGMIDYVGHRARWRAEEQARQATGIPDPYGDVDVRAKEFMYARVLKRLKPGVTKFNEPQYEELEKALVQAANPRRLCVVTPL